MYDNKTSKLFSLPRRTQGILLYVIGPGLLLMCGLILWGCSFPSTPGFIQDWDSIEGQILYLSSPTSLALLSEEGSETLVIDLPFPVDSLGLSPDGKSFAFVGAGHLWIGDVEQRKFISATLPSNIVPTSEWRLEWSPDGARIALGLTSALGLEYGVYTLATGELQLLSPCLNSTQDIYWLHEKRLIFSTGDALWIFDLDTNASEKAAPKIEDNFRLEYEYGLEEVKTPVVSRSGRMAALVDDTSKPQVRIYDWQTGLLLRTITPPVKTIRQITWSPDEQMLAFVDAQRTQEGEYAWAGYNEIGNIVIMNLDGEILVRVATAYAVDLAWSR